MVNCVEGLFEIYENNGVDFTVLMIDVIEGSIKGRQSLITRTGIFSMPGALCVAFELTVASTCLFSTTYKVNCSDVA